METFFYILAGVIILLIVWEILFTDDGSQKNMVWDHSPRGPGKEIEEIELFRSIDRH